MLSWSTHRSKLAYVADALSEMICIFATLTSSDTSGRILSALTYSSNTPVSTLNPSLTWALTTTIAIVGGFLRLSADRALGRQFTFELALLEDHKLIISGPFSVVRYPSYTGALALSWGSAFASASPGSWMRHVLIDGAIQDGFTSGPAWAPYARSFGLVMSFLLFIGTSGGFDRMRQEDEMLKRGFGKEWEIWTQKTPHRLVPGIY
jgi:protein-S-isoprenylcysteine O-methyltransferase Ste14